MHNTHVPIEGLFIFCMSCMFMCMLKVWRHFSSCKSLLHLFLASVCQPIPVPPAPGVASSGAWITSFSSRCLVQGSGCYMELSVHFFFICWALRLLSTWAAWHMTNSGLVSSQVRQFLLISAAITSKASSQMSFPVVIWLPRSAGWSVKLWMVNTSVRRAQYSWTD